MFTFYCTNNGKTMTADKEGWWVSYETESTDQGAILIPKELVPAGIKDEKKAQELIEKVMEWEWEDDYFYATVKAFGYCSESDLIFDRFSKADRPIPPDIDIDNVEPIFEMRIEENKHIIRALNKEAEDVEKKWNAKFPNHSIIFFILNTPNELSQTSNDSMIYKLDMSFEEEISRDLERFLK